MKQLLTLGQQDIDSTAVSAQDRDAFFLRESVRAVLLDEVGAVALLHSAERSYFKLPGGGIEEGEEPEEAIFREILEETGGKSRIIGELGRVVEYRDFVGMKQTSDCYIARTDGAKGEPCFTEDEIAEGFELVWVSSIGEAIQIVRDVNPLDDMQIKFMRRRELVILEAAQEILALGLKYE